MIHSFLLFIALNTASVFLAANLLQGFQVTGGTFGFIVVGIIVGILNLFIKPVLQVLSLPFIFLTGGLFTIVLNVAILWLAQELIRIISIGGITLSIEGAVTYLFAVIILGFLNFIFHHLLS